MRWRGAVLEMFRVPWVGNIKASDKLEAICFHEPNSGDLTCQIMHALCAVSLGDPCEGDQGNPASSSDSRA